MVKTLFAVAHTLLPTIAPLEQKTTDIIPRTVLEYTADSPVLFYSSITWLPWDEWSSVKGFSKLKEITISSIKVFS